MAKSPNPVLVKYIEKHLAKGFHIKHVKRKLAEVGHPIDAIEDAAQYVLAGQPKARSRRFPKFMIVYGVILILIIAGFVWFIWFKATQQIEYKATVNEIEKKQEYSGMTDVELIKLAAKNNDLSVCDSIKGEVFRYSCLDKRWEQEDCFFEIMIGEDRDSCFAKLAQKNDNSSICQIINDVDMKKDCLESFGIVEPAPINYKAVGASQINLSLRQQLCSNPSPKSLNITLCLFLDAIDTTAQTCGREIGGGRLTDVQQFEDNINMMDYCVIFSAVKHKSPQECNIISNQGKSFCDAVLSADSTRCEKLEGQYAPTTCAAWVSKDQSKCGLEGTSALICNLFFDWRLQE